MDHPFTHFLALFALVFYPPIPVMIIFIHRFLSVWRKVGAKSYVLFTFLFFLCFTLLFLLVWHFKEPILSWKFYEGSFVWVGVWLGGLMLISGVVVGIISVHTLSLRVLLGVPEIYVSQVPSRLVTKGIYRYIRHPRYLEFILEVLGITILSGLVWNLILFVYVVSGVWFMSVVEERELVQRFGQQYLEYKTKTGRFLPKLDRR